MTHEQTDGKPTADSILIEAMAAGHLSRRQFVQRASVLGLSAATVGAVLAACWAQERNIADEKVLGALLTELGLPASLLEKSYSQTVQQRYDTCTRAAIDAGVFGAPSYVIDGEIFWGQDRLDFVERVLAS